MAMVYVETTVISYLASRPSRDLLIAAQQQATDEWWSASAGSFELVVSEAVLAEIERGDEAAARKRLALAKDMAVLSLNEDVSRLARIYTEKLPLPGAAQADSLHIAFAVAYEVDYLLTWNCRHIANGRVVRRLRDLNLSMGRFTPLILTPLELMEPE